jgi:hypothetical protein
MWLQFSVLLGGIATTLLNFIKPGDLAGVVSAVSFTITALLTVLYSTALFIYRSLRLRSHSADGLYYDWFGPTALCAVVGASIIINVIMRVAEA